MLILLIFSKEVGINRLNLPLCLVWHSQMFLACGNVYEKGKPEKGSVQFIVAYLLPCRLTANDTKSQHLQLLMNHIEDVEVV